MPHQLPVLGYAVLAQLCREPLTGYQLAQRMRGAMAYFWSAPHSQIYPQLAALSDAGLVSGTEAAGPGPRAKRTYRATTKGRAALASWAVQPVQPSTIRSEIALKAFAAASADRVAMAQSLRDEANRHRELLAAYRNEEQELRRKYGEGLDDPAQPEFGNWSALALGLRSEQTMIDWCEWMIGRLTTEESAPTSRAGRRNRGPHRRPAPSGSG